MRAQAKCPIGESPSLHLPTKAKQVSTTSGITGSRRYLLSIDSRVSIPNPLMLMWQRLMLPLDALAAARWSLEPPYHGAASRLLMLLGSLVLACCQLTFRRSAQAQGLLLDAGRRRPLLHVVDLPMPPRKPRHDYLFNSSPLSVSALLCCFNCTTYNHKSHTNSFVLQIYRSFSYWIVGFQNPV